MISEKTRKALQRSNGVHEIHQLWVIEALQQEHLDKNQINTLNKLASLRTVKQSDFVIINNVLVPASRNHKIHTKTAGKGWVTRAQKTNGRWANSDK